MRIAISATGATLDADVDPRFGRCQHFIIADPETMEFEALDNSNAMAAGGAGISTAQMIADKGIQVVLTGNCGPNAYQVLSASGIQVITGVSGKVKDAIQVYKSGKLQASSQPNVADHFGMGGGMGRGIGRGMGRGMSMGAGMPPVSPASLSPEPETETLKTQLQLLTQKLSEIERRITELESKTK